MFDANVEAQNVAEITLNGDGILTRFVRIYPINCMKEGGPTVHCVIEFEILGC